MSALNARSRATLVSVLVLRQIINKSRCLFRQTQQLSSALDGCSKAHSNKNSTINGYSRKKMAVTWIFSPYMFILLMLTGKCAGFKVQYSPRFEPRLVSNPVSGCHSLCASRSQDLSFEVCQEICRYFDRLNLRLHDTLDPSADYEMSPNALLPDDVRMSYDVSTQHEEIQLKPEVAESTHAQRLRVSKRLPGQCMEECIYGGLKLFQCKGLCL